jgi:hypothetical protein
VTVSRDPGELVWDNGTLITHPGAGRNGADVSMAAEELNLNSIAGSNVLLAAPGPEYRVADDFTVEAGGATVTAVTTYAYQTGSANPNWTGYSLNIWNGRPGDSGSSIVATSTTASFVWSGIYRVFYGTINLQNTDRPVQAIRFDLGSLHLAAGTYWIDWQVIGGASGWAPFVMEMAGGEPQTKAGNGRQLIPGGWVNLLEDDRPGLGAEVPFLVYGAGATSVPARLSPLHGTQPVAGPRPLLPSGYEFRQNDALK